MRRTLPFLLLLLPALASAVPANTPSPRNRSGVSDETRDGSAASVSIRLSATVVGTTAISVRGVHDTNLVVGPRGNGFIRLGTVSSEGIAPRTGNAIERSDDGGAFYVADLRVHTRFSGGVDGELSVSSSGTSSDNVEFRFACSRVPEGAYRRAHSGAVPGTFALENSATTCSGREGEEGATPLQLVMHVPDGARSGRVSGHYVLTAAPELM